ncbi:hypothetical protein P5V34_01790 [Mycobacteroides abscessus subsp. abscessus]|uniref:hypothetical protein n=1 Tax=Mycobacteroides abscessus TaxID=36809 RepID=UPI00266BADF6|nr:hypothetical protein [Mycobacteroides abscessus]MDO3012711.1 hypothetical protein [Mycobacteroides abscessus subsp. abscessus]
MVDHGSPSVAGDNAAQNAALRAYTRIQSVNDSERRSFEPSRLIERLVLQLLGGWSNVIAEVNFARFNANGPDSEWVQENKLMKAVRELAEDSRVRWPHDDFAAAADHAGNVRHQLAHMLFIKEIVGDSPDQILRFVRLGEPGQPRTVKGAPTELKWRDEQWSQQTIHQAELTEGGLRLALAEIKWMWESVRALSRLRDMLAEHPDLPDHHPITLYPWGGWWIPWASEDWFNGNHTPTVGDIRVSAPAESI